MGFLELSHRQRAEAHVQLAAVHIIQHGAQNYLARLHKRQREREELEKKKREAAEAELSKIRLKAGEAARLQSAVDLQRSVRTWLARRRLRELQVADANRKGRLLPLAGTIKGQSGWYQSGDMV